MKNPTASTKDFWKHPKENIPKYHQDCFITASGDKGKSSKKTEKKSALFNNWILEPIGKNLHYRFLVWSYVVEKTEYRKSKQATKGRPG